MQVHSSIDPYHVLFGHSSEILYSFIHSFIHSNISIAPLQVHYYSEALPTPARSKRTVLRHDRMCRKAIYIMSYHFY